MKTHSLSVKTGTFKGRNGEQKNSYESVGEVHDGQYGTYALVNPFVLMGLCMAAITRGESRLSINFYAVEDAGAGRGRSAGAPSPSPSPAPDFHDEVPF